MTGTKKPQLRGLDVNVLQAVGWVIGVYTSRNNTGVDSTIERAHAAFIFLVDHCKKFVGDVVGNVC